MAFWRKKCTYGFLWSSFSLGQKSSPTFFSYNTSLLSRIMKTPILSKKLLKNFIALNSIQLLSFFVMDHFWNINKTPSALLLMKFSTGFYSIRSCTYSSLIGLVYTSISRYWGLKTSVDIIEAHCGHFNDLNKHVANNCEPVHWNVLVHYHAYNTLRSSLPKSSRNNGRKLRKDCPTSRQGKRDGPMKWLPQKLVLEMDFCYGIAIFFRP